MNGHKRFIALGFINFNNGAQQRVFTQEFERFPDARKWCLSHDANGFLSEWRIYDTHTKGSNGKPLLLAYRRHSDNVPRRAVAKVAK